MRGGNHGQSSLLKYCCTWSQTTENIGGPGNIEQNPRFVNIGTYNYRLLYTSPCINAGNNTSTDATTDLAGGTRIVRGTVDIGAYEFSNPSSDVSYAWLQQYGLPTNGSADYIDSDNDTLNNWQEWRCGTDPTNALSVLRFLSPVRDGNNVFVQWQSSPYANYYLERSTNLGATPIFYLLATNLPGQGSITTYIDTNAAPGSPLFYRVGVGN